MDIKVLHDDDLIDEPGFYAMSLERHHNQPCNGTSVTSGVLRKMELDSPADVWAFHKLNPNRWEPKKTDALRLGSAMAAYIESGEQGLREMYQLIPADAPRKPTPAQLKAFEEDRATPTGQNSVAFWRAVEVDGRPVITQKELDHLKVMGEVLRNDPNAVMAMSGLPEITMAWFDEATDLWCLARPDQVSFDGALSDYKKVAPGQHPFNYHLCDRRILTHGYDMQMAFASDAFEALTGEKPNAVGLVFQSDQPPHHVILRDISEEDLAMGSFRNRRALRRFRECLDADHWPGPGDDIGAFQRPEWHYKMMLEQMQIEGVAP